MNLKRLLCVLAVAGSFGCDEPKNSGPKPPETAAAGPTSAPTAKPTGNPPAASTANTSATIACSPLLSAEDVASCNPSAKLMTPPSELDNIGTDSTCSRRYSDGQFASLTMMVFRRSLGGLLPPSQTEWTNVKTIAGLGDEARSYETKNAGGDRTLKVELRKNNFSAVLFTSALKGEPLCDIAGLEKLARTVAGRLP